MPDKDTLKNKSLLIITPDYPDEQNRFFGCNYVKRMVGELCSDFKEVHVIAPVLPMLGITPQSKYCHDYSYKNVHVYFPKGFYLPDLTPGNSRWYQPYFDFRYHAVKSVIESAGLSFDLIHAQFAYMSGRISEILHRQYSIPYIITIYEDTVWLHHLIRTWGERYLSGIRNAGMVFCINPIDGTLVKEYNGSTVYIPVGYQSEVFRLHKDKEGCRRKLHLPEAKKIIVSVGNLEKRKRFDIFIHALRLLKQDTDIKFHGYIIGRDKGELSSLTGLVAEKGLQHDISIFTEVGDEDLVAFMNAADVLTVQSDSEGFGITQVESFACGTPVVASDNHGSSSLLASDKNRELGELFQRGNPRDMMFKIRSVLSRRFDHQRIVRESEGYRWNVIGDQIKQKYIQVLGEQDLAASKIEKGGYISVH
jgi:glycosyltransferase involved in cell wall biosynthesis